MRKRPEQTDLYDFLPGGKYFGTGKKFDGKTFDSGLDSVRLSDKLRRVLGIMSDGQWHTLSELASLAGCSEAGASARLRDLRKDRFGKFDVESSRSGPSGLWVYRLKPTHG